jgi:hypothetical protein
VFVAHSTDDGKTFARERLATGKPTGACGCCGMKSFADSDGTGWAKGGAVGWQLFDKDGNALSESGRADGVPVWSLATAFAKTDGSFVIVY